MEMVQCLIFPSSIKFLGFYIRWCRMHFCTFDFGRLIFTMMLSAPPPPTLPSRQGLGPEQVPFLVLVTGFLYGSHKTEISNQISALAGVCTPNRGTNLMVANGTTRLPSMPGFYEDGTGSHED